MTDDYCGTNCSSCNWSWPTNDPQQWSSSDAACRCESGGQDSNDSSGTSDYTYGGACANLTDGQCGTNCSSCNWSWPTDDPQQFSSAEADCRCQSSDSNDQDDGGSDNVSPDPDDPAYAYAWGGDCLNNTDDDCKNVSGCSSCKFSWPLDDPLEWNSGNAKCRCQTDDLVPEPIPNDEITFGDDCASLTDQACGDVDCIKCAYSWPKWDPMEFNSMDAMCRCQY